MPPQFQNPLLRRMNSFLRHGKYLAARGIWGVNWEDAVLLEKVSFKWPPRVSLHPFLILFTLFLLGRTDSVARLLLFSRCIN